MLPVFRKFLILYAFARSCVWQTHEGTGGLFAVAGAILFVAFLLSLRAKKLAHWGARLAWPAVALQVVLTFPETANHLFLELYALTLVCLVDGEDDAAGGRLALAGLRALAVLVLFHSGLQKLTLGYYVRGDFLAFMVATQDRFGDVFAWMLPTNETAHLQGQDILRTGSGPFRSAQPLFVAASNLVWITELALAGLLCSQRTRTAAAWVSIGFVTLIQFGAREIGFAALLIGILGLFLLPRTAKRITSVLGALLILLALAAIVGLPIGQWVHV